MGVKFWENLAPWRNTFGRMQDRVKGNPQQKATTFTQNKPTERNLEERTGGKEKLRVYTGGRLVDQQGGGKEPGVRQKKKIRWGRGIGTVEWGKKNREWPKTKTGIRGQGKKPAQYGRPKKTGEEGKNSARHAKKRPEPGPAGRTAKVKSNNSQDKGKKTLEKFQKYATRNVVPLQNNG